MTSETNPDVVGSQGSATGQAGGVGSQGTAGGTGAAAGYTTQGYEGSIKQSSDIGAEEAMAILQTLTPKQASFFSDLVALNAKRTYDQSQSLDLATQVGDTNQRTLVNNLAVQALQNAVETANMVSKQAVRHSDIAIDRQWNVNETDALAAAVATAVAKALQK